MSKKNPNFKAELAQACELLSSPSKYALILTIHVVCSWPEKMRNAHDAALHTMQIEVDTADPLNVQKILLQAGMYVSQLISQALCKSHCHYPCKSLSVTSIFQPWLYFLCSLIACSFFTRYIPNWPHIHSFYKQQFRSASFTCPRSLSPEEK